MSNLKDLKQEAKELGIEFSANIGEVKLQAKIDEHYAAKETGAPAPLTKVEAEPKATKSGNLTGRALANQREKVARKTSVVNIIDNDQRVNNQTTSCTVSCSNDYFDLGTMTLPLGMDVEVAQGHIDVLQELRIPQHTKDPKTGLSSVSLRPRYSVIKVAQ